MMTRSPADAREMAAFTSDSFAVALTHVVAKAGIENMNKDMKSNCFIAVPMHLLLKPIAQKQVLDVKFPPFLLPEYMDANTRLKKQVGYILPMARARPSDSRAGRERNSPSQ